MKRVNRSEAIASLFPEVSIDGVTVSALYSPHSEHEGQPGWVQGGFVATVLDYICACAATEAFGAQAITGGLSVRYSSPVLIEQGPYAVEASVVSSVAPKAMATRRTVRIQGSVVDPGGTRVVSASGLFVRQRRNSE